MLGVMKAGAAYVSLDPSHPQLRLKSILNSVNAKYVLAGTDHIWIFRSLDVHTIAINSSYFETLTPIATGTGYSCRTLRPSDPVCIVFTSGSTGQPKGIVLEHSSICTSALAHGAATNIGLHSRVLQFAAYTFDVSIQDIFTTLMRGGCVCVISDYDRLNNLAGAIRDLNVNWACLTSTVASILNPNDVPSLETLVLGGEPATREVIASWASEVELFNVYGPAESSIWTSCKRIAHKDDDPANIGTALASRLWVADMHDHNKLVPIGAIGELLLEGPLLARGYLNDDEKTRSAFIENPVWSQRVQNEDEPTRRRFYKTGDLVRNNTDGTIRYIQRKDSQIKLHGQRLELGEIEYHIKTLLTEAQHVAVDLATAKSSTTLLAFLQFRDQSLINGHMEDVILPMTDALRARLSNIPALLADRLPSSMVPSGFIVLRQIPTTTSGKLDRKALRQIVSELSPNQLANYSVANSSKQAPTTSMEMKLHSLWVKMMHFSESSIGIDDNFFSLGGDSIIAMRLVGEARTGGLTLTVGDIFRYPRLSDLAAHIAQDSSGIQQPLQYEPYSLLNTPENNDSTIIQDLILSSLNYPKKEVEDVLPATDFQALAITGLFMRNRWMLNYFWFEGEGPILAKQLNQAFTNLIREYDILRTVFALYRDQYYQVVLKEIDPVFATLNTDQDLVEFTKNLQVEDSKHEIDLRTPLIKLTLVRQRRTKKYRIIIRMSHAQYDGMSLPRLWLSLFATYQAQNQSNIPRSSFSIYMAHSAARNSPESLEHWRKLLAGSSMTQIVKRDRLQYFHTRDHTIALTRKVDLLPYSLEGVTFATLLKAAWSFTLVSLTGENDVVFGNVISGRNEGTVEMEEIVGPCLNVIPVRAAMAPGLKVIDLLHTVQDQQVANMPFETLSFRKIIRDCTNWPSWTYYSSVLQHQNIDDRPQIFLGDSQVKLGVLATPERTADVYVFSVPSDDHVEITLSATANVTPVIAQSLIDTLCDTISGWAQDLHQALPALKIAPQTNSHRVEDESKSSIPSTSTKEYTYKRTMEKVWREVLNFDGDIDMASSFFNSGGDMIAAGQLCLLLQREGLFMSIEEIMGSPTLGEQLELLTRK